MNSENGNIIITILTSTVIASLLTSIVNIFLACVNNHKLKKIENEKHKNELTSYRYTQLFNILLKWHEYDSPYDTDGKSISKIANDRILNGFLDDCQRLKLIIPLIDSKYINRLEIIEKQGQELLKQLIDLENQMDNFPSDKIIEEHKNIFDNFKENAVNLSNEINIVIQQQLQILLEKSD